MTNKKVDQFVHLHTHTHFSILDGHDTIDELVAEVSRLGQPAVAVTDHGSLSGLYDLYNAAKKADITPIAGCEFYMTPSIGSRTSREPLYLGDGGRDDVSGRGAYTHITILAENNVGLKNLFQLSLKASSEGFYQKPRIDFELLQKHAEGLIVTTGCPSGEVQTWLRLGHPDKALQYAAKLQEIFGKENVFMELMEHGMAHDLERGVRAGLLEIAAKLNMPLLATNDLHYATKADCESHEQMLAIQTRSVMSEPPEYEGGRRFAFEGGSYYVKSAAEMASLFPDHPDALKNTLLIAERSSFEVEPDETLRPQLPGIPEGETEASWLRKEAYKGLAKRLPDKVNDPVYIDRLNMELEVLEMKGFSGYFLVVSDFVKWGKFVAEPPVPTGYGRGCLSADANILTPDGFKKISDIKVGDIVFDELGNQVKVPNVFEYDCDEPLVEIKGYYGNQGNKMTADHKVLISRANKETSPTKLSSGIKYKQEINPTEWVRADEVQVGDLVVMPKLKFDNFTQGFHFNPESTVTENSPLKFSVRSIARQLGVARSTVMKFISSKGEVKGVASQKISNYFTQNNITIEQMKAQQTVTTVLEKDYVEANYDLGFVFGLFISDGWIRKDSETVIGFAQNKEEDEGTIPTIIEKVFGISPHVTDHKTKNLRQFVYRHKGIYELFANLFKEYNYTAQTKYIPKELMNTSEEFRRGLLEGLWYGDGSHNSKSKYSTVSEPLAEGVYTLLLSLGLPASIMETKRVEKRPEYNKAQRESWTEYSITTAHYFDTNKLRNAKGYDGNFTYYRVREINIVEPEGKVYDFTVPTTNSYVTDSYVVHNSAAGSLVAFVMDITDADPIRFDLLFERFINPERDSPPDIDMDFNDVDRERVVEYVKEKYGLEYVAHVATFGKIGAKTAIKDVVRILERPYAQGDALSKALPPAVFGKEIKLSEVYDSKAERYHEAGEFRELVEKEKLQDVITAALKLEGRTRSIGVHAAALVISSQPVVETIPMFMRQNDGAFITQWDYPTAEALGLLKVDFLGLRNLGVIANTIHHIKATRGQDVDLQEIIQGPMDDPATYKLLQRGDTLGIFQLDGGGMRKLLKQLKPTEFDDISAVLSLYRPGPMGVDAHTDYALRKNGLQAVTPIHPEFKESLADILGPTYNLVVYQEQVQRIAQRIAGYSLAQADLLRRAMGKKKRYIIDAEFVPFSEGAKKNGYSDEAIKALWDILVPFADYAFNKSHTVGYGLISYVTAYLKANYPAEFMAALLSSVADDTDKTALYLNECKHMGIKVYPPAVSRSIEDYRPVSETEIYFGLKAIRGMGAATAEEIVKARGDKPFKSFSDFMHRMPDSLINKRVLEGLAQGGGFDDFGIPRKSLIAAFPDMLKAIQKARKKAKTGMMSLFDDDEDDMLIFNIMDIGEYTKLEKLKLERHALGLYVSDHPLNGLQIDGQSDATVYDLTSETIPLAEGGWGRPQKLIKVSGIVTSLEKKRTKAGSSFAVGTIEDMTGGIPFAMFSKVFEEYGADMKLDGVYQFSGQHRKRSEEDEIQFIIDSVRPLDFGEHGHLNVKVRLTARQWLDGRDKFLERLERHHMDKGSLIQMSILDGKEIHDFTLDGISVKRSPQLIADIRELFGIDAIGRWRSVE